VKVLAWMAAGCVASALAAVAAAGFAVAPEVVLGMLGPLVITAASWWLTERTYRRHPAALTSQMARAFAAKLGFFGAYVAVMLAVLSLQPVPFVASFTTYFIALHLTEAWLMQRMFAGKSLGSDPNNAAGAGPR
jgi:hypothetical protein